MISRNDPDGLTGLNALDLGVLSGMYDLGLLPSNRHRPTVEALDHIAASGLCGSEDAERVIRRLASSWLLPLPLVEVHGNNGTMYQPPTQPLYTEARLTTAGQLALEAARSMIAPLPIGLINGDIHLVLGLGFGRWEFRQRRSPPGVEPEKVQPLQLRPGFQPRRAIDTLVRLLENDSLSDREIIELIGAPLLLPFEDPGSSLEELLTTGEQVVPLTPTPDPNNGDEVYPTVEIALSTGATVPGLLRNWISESATTGRTVTAAHLERLLAVG